MASPPAPAQTLAVAPQLAPEAAGRRTYAPLVTRRTIAGIAIFAAVLLFFLTQTRIPATLLKFETVERAQTARDRTGFSQVLDPHQFPPALRWVAYGVNLWDSNAIGMFFAMLLGGAAVSAMAPVARLRRLLRLKGTAGAGVGGILGLPLFMCSACSAPVSLGFYRMGAAAETSLGMILGSALFNPVGIVAVLLLFPAPMVAARVSFGLAAVLLLAPAAARLSVRGAGGRGGDEACAVQLPDGAADVDETWPRAVSGALRAWVRNTLDVTLRLAPPMLLASFAVGVVFTLLPPQLLSDRATSGLVAILAAAAVGTLVQLPTLFEIPLVLGVLALGLDPGPATALLVTAPSAGLVTLGVTRGELGWRAPALLLAGTFVGGVAAAVGVSWL